MCLCVAYVQECVCEPQLEALAAHTAVALAFQHVMQCAVLCAVL